MRPRRELRLLALVAVLVGGAFVRSAGAEMPATVYALRYVGTFPNGVEELVGIDPSTGEITSALTIAAGEFFVAQSVNALDLPGQRYFFQGFMSQGPSQLFSVDLKNGAVTAVPLQVSNIQYDRISRSVYGLRYVGTFPNGVEELVGIDPSTGAIISTKMVATGAFSVAQGVSAFDTAGQRYFFQGFNSQGPSQLYTVDLKTGGVTAVLLPGSNIEYDEITETIYVLRYVGSFPNGVEELVGIHPSTGAITSTQTVAFGDFSIAQGGSTFDTARRRYLFQGSQSGGAFQLFAVDLKTGSVTSAPLPAGNVEFRRPICEVTDTFDTDHDGLPDCWEESGVIGEDAKKRPLLVDLPVMGADPEHRDVFVEIDYMVPATGHTHEPKPPAIDRIVAAFANAPVTNPDSTLGINLHVDCGPACPMNKQTGATWKALSEADSLAHVTLLGKVVGNSYEWDDFDAIKKDRLSPGRAGSFHYVIFAHLLGGLGGSSGISRGLPDSDFIVSLGHPIWTGQTGDEWEQAGTFMHELGHNLSLHHGGADEVNHKPNYLSVMNYSFQMSGLFFNGSQGKFDYSRFVLPLDETRLDERRGLDGGPMLSGYGTAYFGPGPPIQSSLSCAPAGQTTSVKNANGAIDWNCNTVTESFVSSAVSNCTDPAVGCTWMPQSLTPFEDWSHLVFKGGAIGSFGATGQARPTLTAVQPELDPERDARITRPYRVAVVGPGVTRVKPGAAMQLTFDITNRGSENDVYALTLNGSGVEWLDGVGIPATVALGADRSQKIAVTIEVPLSTPLGTTRDLHMTAVSQFSDRVTDVGDAVVIVDDSAPNDATPPVILPMIAGTLGDNGWYQSDVTIVWSTSDPESGIASSSGCEAGLLITDTLGMMLTCTVSNGAGLSSSESVTVRIDRTPPTLTIAAPLAGAVFTQGEAILAGYTCQDNGSGLASCTGSVANGSPIDTSTIGSGILEVTGTDSGGNSASASVAFTVTGPRPVFSAQPINQNVISGQNTQLMVTTTSGGLTYQWQKSTNAGVSWINLTDVPPYNGANTATLLITGATVGLDGTQYRCVATNGAVSATSNAAVLTVRPKVITDTDGDGKADLAIFRPSSGTWFIAKSATGYASSTVFKWGISGDVAVPGDYDGDGIGDIAVYRPATGTWYILLSSTSFGAHLSVQWGVSTDVPVPGDYDGDGKTDTAIYRPATGMWWVQLSSSNRSTYFNYEWGVSTDMPVPGDYDGDRKADFAIYRPATGTWWVQLSSANRSTYFNYQWGVSTDMPVSGDYDGDGKADIAVWRPSNGIWFIRYSSLGNATYNMFYWGLPGDVPIK